KKRSGRAETAITPPRGVAAFRTVPDASEGAKPMSGVDDEHAPVLRTLAELIAQQEAKLAACEARIAPHLTADGLRTPHALPELARDPGFNYEDGLLAGLRSAAAAIRALPRR